MTACTKTVYIPKPEAPSPAYYQEDCVETAVAMATNGDLVIKIQQLRTDLAMCNADRAAIRAWAGKLK